MADDIAGHSSETPHIKVSTADDGASSSSKTSDIKVATADVNASSSSKTPHTRVAKEIFQDQSPDDLRDLRKFINGRTFRGHGKPQKISKIPRARTASKLVVKRKRKRSAVSKSKFPSFPNLPAPSAPEVIADTITVAANPPQTPPLRPAYSAPAVTPNQSSPPKTPSTNLPDRTRSSLLTASDPIRDVYHDTGRQGTSGYATYGNVHASPSMSRRKHQALLNPPAGGAEAPLPDQEGDADDERSPARKCTLKTTGNASNRISGYKQAMEILSSK